MNKDKNKDKLSTVEKGRYNQSAKAFFTGCESFIKKCLQERQKQFDENNKIIEKTFAKNKVKDKKDDSEKKKLIGELGKFALILGGLYVTLKFIYDEIDEHKDKMSSTLQTINDDFTDKGTKFLNGENEGIKKTNKKYEELGESLGDTVIQNIRGFFSRGDAKFGIPELKQNGFLEPIFKSIIQVGLYWSMLSSGLEWFANMFGITEPSLVQLQFGVFAQLSGDTDFYFHRTDGKRGIQGVEETVKGYSYIKLIQGNTSLLLSNAVSGSSIDVSHLNQFVQYINEIQKRIDESVKNGVYDLEAFNAYLETAPQRLAALGNIASTERWRNTPNFNALHYILPNQYPGHFSDYGDTGLFPWFKSSSDLHFVNDMVKYVEEYLGTSFRGSSQNFSSTRELNDFWNSIKGYWRRQWSGSYWYTPKEGARWVTIEVLKFLSFVPLVAEHEIHAARQSVIHLQTMLDDFMVQSQSNQQAIELMRYVSGLKTFTDEFVKLYNNNIISLKEYMQKVKNEVDEILRNYNKTFTYSSDNRLTELEKNKYIDLFFNEVGVQSYANKLKKLVKDLIEINTRVYFNLNDDGSDQATVETDAQGNEIVKAGPITYITVNNFIDDATLNNRKVAQDGQREDIGDYLGEEIQGSIRQEGNLSDVNLQLFFSVNSVIDEKIREERSKRLRLIKLILEFMDKLYKKPDEEQESQ